MRRHYLNETKKSEQCLNFDKFLTKYHQFGNESFLFFDDVNALLPVDAVKGYQNKSLIHLTAESIKHPSLSAAGAEIEMLRRAVGCKDPHS